MKLRLAILTAALLWHSICAAAIFNTGQSSPAAVVVGGPYLNINHFILGF